MNQKLIYDVGMHNGDDTAYYLHCGYSVVAIEANPLLVAQARRRFEAEIQAGRLTLVNAGITETEGRSSFWVCDSNTVWSSFDREVAARDGAKHHEEIIHCKPFGAVLKEHGIPYSLKIDIEGNDHLCIDALEAGSLPKYVSFEGGPNGFEFQRLRDLGYSHFKGISQFAFLPLELPPTPQRRDCERAQRIRERAQRLRRSRNLAVRIFRRLGGRRYLEELAQQRPRGFRTCRGWNFPEGSSGPFGEGLPGRWQTADELLDTYSKLKAMRHAGQPSVFWSEEGYSFWTDIHARWGAPDSPANQ
jgi:FkbM family methyltransferase